MLTRWQIQQRCQCPDCMACDDCEQNPCICDMCQDCGCELTLNNEGPQCFDCAALEAA